MSVNWNWDDRFGTMYMKQMHEGEEDREVEVSLYNGNCMMVMLHEFKDKDSGEDMYDFWGFFCDKEHAKNCLGLARGHNNIYNTPYETVTKIVLNKKKCRYFKEIVELFTKAFDDIVIEVKSAE